MGNLENDEDRLWSRSLNGDGEAFGVLYDRHRDRVFRHAYRLAGNHHDAEDVMAAAFLELWRRRAKVRVVDGSILPWLLVTTTNTARNNGRAALRYRKLLDSLPRAEESSELMKTELFASLQEPLDKDFAKALGTLNAEDLQLVSLVVFEDYPLAAAAAVLNLTPGAAKTRMHRARQRLKAALTGTTSTGAPTARSHATSVLEGERS
ncbi:sigma-70 family RNA polymerase sigma factor [Pseudarthrobacter psychrotolerans]|uniref:Sigma-70 family RNA polymerase sigma factor n=1 Tax=Pseudarthrobacter psychrotolerans TaxID=2697569 RepID=A0A6P1NV14_9MICC|nr:sigma-70 family RNA polymerase sigma factor [Pseudarthrobacter psychrotolerans]QHK20691.1 sigma-70 family RNA polymerase sigma factor [Pseudarthrobacter psychrotolerans]